VLVGSTGLECVKLSDVGLSRTLKESDYYRKTTKGKVPAKWMAIEYLSSGRFSHASDVWSFGIMCWELYSFGEEPYPGLIGVSLVDRG
jgi:serine/threonine protein kinase